MAFQTYQAVGNREIVQDVVDIISPYETPLYTRLPKVRVEGTYCEWITDAIRASKKNAAIEGATVTYDTVTARGRTGNYTQIFTGGFQISETQERVVKYGLTSEEAFQKEQGIKALKKDFEYALINGTGNSGTSGAARELKGYLSWVTTNVYTGSSGTGTDLGTANLNATLMHIWTVSESMPKIIMMNGIQASKRLGSTTYFPENTRFMQASQEALYARIMVYHTYFGDVDVVLSRHVDQSHVLIVNTEKFQVGVLRGLQAEEMPKSADAVNFRLVCEQTLISLHEAASGLMTGLSTS